MYVIFVKDWSPVQNLNYNLSFKVLIILTKTDPTQKEPTEPIQPTVEVCGGLPRTQQEPNELWRSLRRITEDSDERVDDTAQA